jgi:hypothetical protein
MAVRNTLLYYNTAIMALKSFTALAPSPPSFIIIALRSLLELVTNVDTVS